MKSIVFISNIERQQQQMQQALRKCKISAAGQVVGLQEDALWTAAWQHTLDQCACLVCSWMGHGKEWSFLEKTKLGFNKDLI